MKKRLHPKVYKKIIVLNNGQYVYFTFARSLHQKKTMLTFFDSTSHYLWLEIIQHHASVKNIYFKRFQKN